MSPTLMTLAIEACVRAKRPAMVWSQPGMGKSQIFKQTAERIGFDLWDVRLSGRDPVDVFGLPFIDNGSTRWAPPSLLPKKGKSPSILFLDEVNRASQMMLNVALQLVLDRRIGDYTLPDDCVVMAAGNPESDPGVIRMSDAMHLRFEHLMLEINHDDWCNWAVKAGIEAVVIAFLRFRPDLLHKFEAKALSSPNPRGWQFVSELIAQDPDPRIEHELFKGCLGEAAAVEFTAFRRLFKSLPQIDAILLDPKKVAIPAEPSVRYAVAAALSRRATETNFGRILAYLERMPVEYNVLSTKMALRHTTGLASTPEFTKWSVAHADVTF